MVAQVTYVVTARRSEGWWALHAEAIRGTHTQVKRLDQAEDMVRDAISLLLEVDPLSFDVQVVPELDADLTDVVNAATRARSQAADASTTAARTTQAAARRLVEGGLTVRDAGVLLGISHQRVAQLLQAVSPGGPS